MLYFVLLSCWLYQVLSSRTLWRFLLYHTYAIFCLVIVLGILVLSSRTLWRFLLYHTYAIFCLVIVLALSGSIFADSMAIFVVSHLCYILSCYRAGYIRFYLHGNYIYFIVSLIIMLYVFLVSVPDILVLVSLTL